MKGCVAQIGTVELVDRFTFDELYLREMPDIICVWGEVWICQ